MKYVIKIDKLIIESSYLTEFVLFLNASELAEYEFTGANDAASRIAGNEGCFKVNKKMSKRIIKKQFCIFFFINIYYLQNLKFLEKYLFERKF